MTHLPSTKRAQCVNCLRPKSTCICQWVTPVANKVEVLLLQHPLEVAEAKGSARLLHLSLSCSPLLTGEVFGVELSTALQPPRYNILLYPDTQDSHAIKLPAPLLMDERCLQQPERLRLVVLDGTWRKSRKMLYLNPQLQQLPRFSLSDVPASRYLIRKAHGAHQLSTLEATCMALMQLESDQKGAEKYEPLLKAFDHFVAQQIAYQQASTDTSPLHGNPQMPQSLRGCEAIVASGSRSH